MPAIRIPAGILRGESRAYVPGRYSGGSLIRWHEGNLRPVGGWERITPTPFASVPRAGLSWMAFDNRRYMAVLCDGHCYRYVQDDGWQDVTPPDYLNAEAVQGTPGYGSGAYGLGEYGRDDVPRGVSTGIPFRYMVSHSIDFFGQDLLFGSSVEGKVFAWRPDFDPDAAENAGKTNPAVVPDAPVGIQCFLSTAEHHLMTFGAAGFPNRVSWSDQGDREGWDYNDVTGQAGFYDLEGAGKIIAARKVAAGILIFTDTNVWLCSYTGAPYFYGFQKVSEGLAPISPHAIATVNNRAFWMTTRGFWKFENNQVMPVPCGLDLEPFESMDLVNAPRRVHAGHNGVYPEIWWFYPSRGQNGRPVADRYVIYNFADGWWSEGVLERSFFSADPIEVAPLAGSASTLHIYQHEKGMLADGTPREGLVWAEVGAVGFDDGENNWTVTQMQVDGRAGSGPEAKTVRFDFSGVNARGAEYRPLGSWSPHASGYMDCRFTAKDFGYRIVGLKDLPWAVGAIVFKAVKRGYR